MGFLNWISRGPNNAHIAIPEHHNGTATTAWAKIECWVATNKLISLFIKNTDSTNSLYVSLDGSDNYVTLDTTNRSLSYSGDIYSIRVKSSAGTATYESILNREP